MDQLCTKQWCRIDKIKSFNLYNLHTKFLQYHKQGVVYFNALSFDNIKNERSSLKYPSNTKTANMGCFLRRGIEESRRVGWGGEKRQAYFFLWNHDCCCASAGTSPSPDASSDSGPRSEKKTTEKLI